MPLLGHEAGFLVPLARALDLSNEIFHSLALHHGIDDAIVQRILGLQTERQWASKKRTQ